MQQDQLQWKYIEETGRIFKFRLDEHRGYITNKDESQPTVLHFNLPGHSLANLKATVIEQVIYNDEEYRKEREHYYINKFNTYHDGMNKKKYGTWRGLLFLFDIVFYLIKFT